MSFLALILALGLEYWQPAAIRRLPQQQLTRLLHTVQQHFDAGELRHGQLSWLLVVVPPALLIIGLFWLLDAIHPLLGLLFCLPLLYLTLDFRRLNQPYSEIQQALQADDLPQAAALLSQFSGETEAADSASRLARRAIELTLHTAHRHLFGVIVWFLLSMVLGMGPVGALIYRLAQRLNDDWGRLSAAEHGDFGAFSGQVYRALEWLPQRLTAFTFAIVGDFENAIDSWRTQAGYWPHSTSAIVLASGAGALGVRLGTQDGLSGSAPGGEEADAELMQSAIGLVWRALVFWLVLLLLFTLSTLVN